MHGVEYTFGAGGGIFSHRPRAVPGEAAPGGGAASAFRCQVKLGDCAATSREVEVIVAGLRAEWPGARYHLLKANCNNFANDLSVSLVGKPIPGWVNRAASMGVSGPRSVPRSVAERRTTPRRAAVPRRDAPHGVAAT